ncbi:MAG: hypothetical protein ACREEV_11285 [Dongiaceae bacterium]
MHAHAIALSALLLAAAADPADVRTQSHDTSVVDPVAASGKSADQWIQLAAGGKLADKYMAGKAGGRYGIGGSKEREKKRNKKDGK